MNNKVIAGVAVVIVLVVVGFASWKMFLTAPKDELAVSTSEGSVVLKDGAMSVKGPGGSVDMDIDGLAAQSGEGSAQITTGTTAIREDQPTKNIVLVVDDSGSMSEIVAGKAKIDVAKEAAGKFISGLTEGVNLSIVVYGHKGNNTQAQKAVSCQGIEEVYYMGAVNDVVAQGKINKLVPTGWTPIADSLIKAKSVLMKTTQTGSSENRVVLLSDGEETCGGNPVAVAQELCRAGIDVDVIGLGVSGAVQTQLSDIAVAGCGKYFDVDTTEQIQNAFIQVGGASIDIQSFNGSATINSGNMDLRADDGRSATVQDGKADFISPDGRTMKVNADGSATLDNGSGQNVTLPSGSVNINDYGY